MIILLTDAKTKKQLLHSPGYAHFLIIIIEKHLREGERKRETKQLLRMFRSITRVTDRGEKRLKAVRMTFYGISASLCSSFRRVWVCVCVRLVFD